MAQRIIQTIIIVLVMAILLVTALAIADKDSDEIADNNNNTPEMLSDVKSPKSGEHISTNPPKTSGDTDTTTNSSKNAVTNINENTDSFKTREGDINNNTEPQDTIDEWGFSTNPNTPITSDASTQAKPNDNASVPVIVPEDDSWAYWLINADNPLPDNYAPELVSIGSYNGDDRRLDSRAAQYALNMMLSAKNDGINLVPVSAHRRYETQRRNFIYEYDTAKSRGLSHDEAFTYTMSQIAVPGTSEHNAGIAIDFNSISESFDQTAEYRWLRDNAHKFGFILRYPKDKIDITGVIYEPWHFRFIGMSHAEKIYNSGLTLEEYMGESANKNDRSVVEAFKSQLG